MKVQIEELSPVKKKLAVSIPEERVLEEFDHAYNDLNQKARIPGFRPGKVPRALLEKKFAASIESEVYQNLVRETIIAALRDHELDAISVPEITEPKREKGSGFSYTASVEVKPTFDVKDYKEIKLKQEKTEVTAEQKAEVMTKLQNAQAVLKDRDGATSPLKGDFAIITLQETDEEGNITAKEEPKEQLVEIGNESLLPTVEKAILKLKKGESAPVALDKRHLRVTLLGIKEKVLPSVDDDFAKSVGPFETLAALRERIEKDLAEEVAEKAKAETVQKLLAEVLKRNPVELPASLVDNELHSMIHGLWSELERAGLKEIPAEYSEENLHTKMKPDAERRVHEQLVIEAVAKKESLSVDEKDLNDRLSRMAKAAKVPIGEFRAFCEKTGRLDSIRFQMLAQKTLDFLLSTAHIK